MWPYVKEILMCCVIQMNSKLPAKLKDHTPKFTLCTLYMRCSQQANPETEKPMTRRVRKRDDGDC